MPSLRPLLEDFEKIAGQRIEEMDLSLQENGLNEVLTQFLSAREAAKYIKDNPALQRGLNDPIYSLFARTLTKGRKPLKDDGLKAVGRNVLDTVAEMDDKDLLEFAYNQVYGPHERKTEDQINAQKKARELWGKAEQKAVRAYKKNNNLRSEELRGIWVEEFYRLAKKEGLDARFVQGLSTFSVGDKTSVADYQGKGRGDALMNGDAALMDVVIEVNGEKMDITRSFVVSRTKDGGLQMTGIDYTKKGEEFKKYIDGLGLSRQQKQGHLAINETLHRILEGLEMGADGERKIKRYEEMTAKAVDIISSHKIGKKFGFWRKIHEVFGEEGAHNFGLGHFQDRSP